mmetsp:Transcript_7412/g.21034  ORF Transcript_7412/g.21034 Transcript_7412/m.21034 type:complete len:470 (+) Transcript_7412:287-1696(+)
MIWIPRIFLGISAEDTSSSPGGSTSDRVPLHPRQQFRKLCDQIAASDSDLQDLCLHDVVTMTQTGLLSVLGKSLSKNTHLQRLHLQLGEDTPASRRIIHSLFRKSSSLPSSLTTLSLSGTTLGGKQLCCIVLEGLGSLPLLQCLDLSRCHIQDEDIHWFALQMSKNKTLKSQRSSSLEQLNLERNLFSGGPNLSALINHIGSNTNHASSLRILNLSHNKLTMDVAILHMISCLELSLRKSLEELDMAHNLVHITCETPLRIAEFFPSMRSLQLAGNAATSRSQVGPFDPIRSNLPKTLKYLCLRGCNLYDEDILLLAQAIREERCRVGTTSVPVLERLDLSYNHLTEESFVALLCQSPLLMRKLNLAHNLVQDGSKVLGILEEDNYSRDLCQLNLHRNRLSRTQVKRIAFWVRLNASGARHYLMSCRGDQVQASLAVWTQILARASRHPEVAYHILVNHPCLLLWTGEG